MSNGQWEQKLIGFSEIDWFYLALEEREILPSENVYFAVTMSLQA